MEWCQVARPRVRSVNLDRKNLDGGRSAAGREPVIGRDSNLQFGAGRLESPTITQDRRQDRRKSASNRVLLQLRDNAVVSGSLGILVN